MKAISLKQPFAWLMVNGYKMPEFRNRASYFRGECYVQASKNIDKDALKYIPEKMPEYRALLNAAQEVGQLVTGKVIGKLTIVDCIPTNEAIVKYPDDIWLKTFNDKLGKYTFITESPVVFYKSEMFDLKGKIFPLFFDVEVSNGQ